MFDVIEAADANALESQSNGCLFMKSSNGRPAGRHYETSKQY
jgi:hypothetical protein